jgi:CRISPR-associated protein Cas6
VSVWPDEASQDMVDVVFELDAGTLADDHAEALADALRRALPWLADEPRAGILPLSGLGRADGRHCVGRRSRLAIRLPHSRRASADLLCGTTLDLDGVPLGLGRCSLRPLLPITEVVYSHFVSFGTADEIEFLAACRAALAEQGIGGTPVTGRARHLNTGRSGAWLHPDAVQLSGQNRWRSRKRPGPASPAWLASSYRTVHRRRRR